MQSAGKPDQTLALFVSQHITHTFILSPNQLLTSHTSREFSYAVRQLVHCHGPKDTHLDSACAQSKITKHNESTTLASSEDTRIHDRWLYVCSKDICMTRLLMIRSCKHNQSCYSRDCLVQHFWNPYPPSRAADTFPQLVAVALLKLCSYHTDTRAPRRGSSICSGLHYPCRRVE